MDIEEIKKQARQGDVYAMFDLAHAYRYGDGVATNSKHYYTWLTKAAENDHLPSQLELIDILRDINNKYSNPAAALHWMKIAQENGATFTKEELAKVGDPNVCSDIIHGYLFDNKRHNFKKAKEMLLRSHPAKDVVLQWAKEYHARYGNNKREISNISYLYLVACNADATEINNIAVQLLAEDEKANIAISVSLFREAHRLGNKYATASYLYCLVYGKGVRKNLELAVEVYYQGNKQNADYTYRFASENERGRKMSVPTTAEWKILCAKHKTKNTVSWGMSKIGRCIYRLLKILYIPSAYWDNQSRIAAKEESAAISAAVAKGDFAAADGCRDDGCTQHLIRLGFLFFLYVFGIATIAAIISSVVSGHIPNWLTYTILTTIFFPSVNIIYGADKIVTKSLAIIVLVSVVLTGGYYLVMVPEWANLISDTSSGFWHGIFSSGLMIILLVVLVIGLIGLIPLLSIVFPMGLWWHYLLGIEEKKGTWATMLYVMSTLSIILGGGYLLYSNGIIF